MKGLYACKCDVSAYSARCPHKDKFQNSNDIFEFALYKLQALLRLGYMYVHCVVALILLAYASTLTAQVSLAIFSPNAPSPQHSKDAKTVWVER